jgi:UDP-N-acetylmuramoyl-L-alanyl-D-glutamate--2,6-diaminopimelate ligase
MEEYFQAKRRLFTGSLGGGAAPRHRVSVLNTDDDYAGRLAAELPDALTFALDHDATYRAIDVRTDLAGSRFTVEAPDGRFTLTSPLRGRFNVYNVLGAFAVARALGIPADACAQAVERCGQVRGRFQTVDEGQDFAVLVDYAHTPDSLENVLKAARTVTEGRVHVVFGCGGDRDRGKRPIMGQIAKRLADRVIVTSDNPRSEDPEAIIAEILIGTGPDVEHNVERREAIAQAIARAAPGDVIVIAGKGHEQGQEFANGRKLPFDDVTVVREALRGLALIR